MSRLHGALILLAALLCLAPPAGDLINKLYVEPPRPVRKDWPVVEIKDANQLSCVIKPQFKDEIAAWLEKNRK